MSRVFFPKTDRERDKKYLSTLLLGFARSERFTHGEVNSLLGDADDKRKYGKN